MLLPASVFLISFVLFGIVFFIVSSFVYFVPVCVFPSLLLC